MGRDGEIATDQIRTIVCAAVVTGCDGERCSCHRPAIGDAAGTGGPVCIRVFGERTRSGYAIEPIRCAIRCRDIGSQSGDAIQARAALEHRFIAAVCQCRCGQQQCFVGMIINVCVTVLATGFTSISLGRQRYELFLKQQSKSLRKLSNATRT